MPDPSVKLKEFRKLHHLTYPLLSDEKSTVIGKFGFDTIPANVIIDRQGRYAANPQDVDAMAKKLDQVMKK